MAEGPGTAEAFEYAKRAYPDNVISVSDMNAGLRAATGASQRFARSDNGGPGGHGNGQWVFAGPSQALYPFTVPQLIQLRTQRVRRRWTDDGDRDQQSLHAIPARPGSPRPAAASGARNVLANEPQWELPRWAARHQRRRRGHASTPTTRAATRSTSAPARRTSAAAAASQASASTSRPTVAIPGPARSATADARRQGHRLDRRQARRPEHDLCRHDDRTARHVVGLLPGVTRPVPGRGQVGPVQVDQRRRDVDVHPQRRGQRGRLHRQRRRVQQQRDLLAARRPRTSSSTRRTRTSSTRARTRAASGARTTPARPGRRSSRR